MVVIHRQNAVEGQIIVGTEEISSRVRTENLLSFGYEFVDGGTDDFRLFHAVGIGVQRKHRHTRITDAKVAFQQVEQLLGFFADALFRHL